MKTIVRRDLGGKSGEQFIKCIISESVICVNTLNKRNDKKQEKTA